MRNVISTFCCLALLVFCTSDLSSKGFSTSTFSMHCPDDVWASCTDELWDLSIYGQAYYHDYSGNHWAGYPYEQWYLNSCNAGYITRTWTVHDAYGHTHSCTQTIHVGSSNGFNEHDIYWPNDHVDVEGCNASTHPNNLGYGNGYPTYNYEACSLIGITYDDHTFQFGPSCKKIIRTWKVIDWCQYVPNSSNNTGLWTFTQVIKVSESEAPYLNCPDDITVGSYDCMDAEVTTIDFELAPSSCGNDYMITNNSPFAYSNGANISGVYPIGKTTVRYKIEYGCGRKKYCYQDVYVEDHSVPVPYCLGRLGVALMGMDTNDDGINDEGMVAVWAKDLNRDSYSPCGHDPLTFSFERDSIVMSRTFTCEDVGENEIQVWVIDALGNRNFCTAIISVQNNAAQIENCKPETEEEEEETEEESEESFVSLKGSVSDAFDQVPNDIHITMEMTRVDTTIETRLDTSYIYSIDSLYANGEWSYIQLIDTSVLSTIDTIITFSHDSHDLSVNQNGIYLDDSLTTNLNYTVSVNTEKLETDKTNIDVYDAQMLLNHVLGLDIIRDPYLLLAADINMDGKIDTDDLFALVKHTQNKDLVNLPPLRWIAFDASQSPEIGWSSLLENTSLHYDKPEVSIEDADFMLVQLGNLNPQKVETKSRNLDIMISKLNEQVETIMANDKLTVIRNGKNTSDFSVSLSSELVNIYPNPFKDDFQLTVLSDKTQKVTFELYDLSGKRVLTYEQVIHPGHHTIRILVPESLNAGIYYTFFKMGKFKNQGKIIKL